jgi:integrating conjugative element protein (TIGR03759 family)
MIKIILILIVMLCIQPAHALEEVSTERGTVIISDGKKIDGDAVRTNLPDSAAKQWGLNATEWTRYQEIMAGQRGVWSPHLDPLTALGVEARNDEELRHFAELWARIEYRRVERELAFEAAKNAAFARLFPRAQPVQYSAASRDRSALALQGAKRLLLFVAMDCMEACGKPLKKLFSLLSAYPNLSADIYVQEEVADDAKLRQWAVRVQLPIKELHAGRLTLNHEAKMLERLQLKSSALPLLLVKTADGQLSPFEDKQ